jgi:hypothetical protein
LLDGVDQLTGSPTDFADLPAGTKAIALPDNSYNRASYFLAVFGRPEGDSACECERVQSSNLSQSLHLMNAAEMKGKLAKADGRAARFAKNPADEENLRELYAAALSRPPTSAEEEIALAHIKKPREDADGKPVAPAASSKSAYEDLIWALVNTKEFLFNH